MPEELKTLERRLRREATRHDLVLTKVRSRQPYLGHPKYLLCSARSGKVVDYTCLWGAEAVKELLSHVPKLPTH